LGRDVVGILQQPALVHKIPSLAVVQRAREATIEDEEEYAEELDQLAQLVGGDACRVSQTCKAVRIRKVRDL
jgi:hypothetical protein